MVLTLNYIKLFFLLWHYIHFRKNGQIHNQNVVCEILRERSAVLDAIILLSRQMHLTPIPRKICASYFWETEPGLFCKIKMNFLPTWQELGGPKYAGLLVMLDCCRVGSIPVEDCGLCYFGKLVGVKLWKTKETQGNGVGKIFLF